MATTVERLALVWGVGSENDALLNLVVFRRIRRIFPTPALPASVSAGTGALDGSVVDFDLEIFPGAIVRWVAFGGLRRRG